MQVQYRVIYQQGQISVRIDASTKAISCDLSAGTNISIDGTTKAISCDLSAGTNISIDASTKAISCDLSAGTNIDITNGVISSTGGGGTTIDTTTDLEVKSLTADDLIVNNIIYNNTTKFNTIVLRRPSGVSGDTLNSINLIEFQVWVNSGNILPTNVSSTFFSFWTNKDVDIGHNAAEEPERIYDEIIDDTSVTNSFNVDNNSPDVALIINLNSLINVSDLQSLILNNRKTNQSRLNRGIGVGIELYNRQEDPTLINPIATTEETTTAEEVYRYEFPAINTYVGGFSNTSSITQIASETLALKEVMSDLNDIITGSLKCDTLTLTGTQINFNNNSFISNTAGSNSGNHLVILINGTEYKINLLNAS